MTSEYSIPVREIPIATLGQAKIPSPLPYGNMINTGKVMLSLSHEYDEDIDTHQTLLFEEAGPRQDLYFDPGKTKCAIVTCGGLCPGLNDVIRAIVLEAYHAYNTPSVLGIRYGLEGFIPSYSHNVMELTPASVEHIYQFGGTLLGSSRGPQEPSEIVDALERLNVSVLFVIGGDGSMKAASAIAKEIGILTPGTEAVEGAVIESMSDEELREFVPRVSVYARVSPEHKIRIVRAWQERGNLVAMTGDGVNDAPALKVADIGCAMGVAGTDVAKGAADMILTDDNFATIVQAVKNGRNVYANIKKAIQFLLSGNTAGILTVLYASLAGLPVPFAAVHLLFINLLTDSLPAIALGLEPHSDAVMQEKPRPRSEGILTKPFLLSVGTEGLVIALATIIAFHIGLASGGAAVASTMAFATLCLSRLFHGFNCKSGRPVLFTRAFWNNKFLLGAFAVGALLLAAVLLIPPLEPLFQVAELSVGLVGCIVGLAFGSMVVIQVLKAIRSMGKK